MLDESLLRLLVYPNKQTLRVQHSKDMQPGLVIRVYFVLPEALSLSDSPG